MSPVIFALLGAAVALYGWEYSAVRYELAFSPSIYLQYIADTLGRFFEAYGRFVAWISSFLTIFDFSDMYTAGLRLVNPLIEIILSGTHAIIGYVSEINVYDYPYVVVAGSIIIIAATIFAIYYFRIFPSVNEYFANIAEIAVAPQGNDRRPCPHMVDAETNTGTNNSVIGHSQNILPPNQRRSNRMFNRFREASESSGSSVD